jgi:hypothetical protein
MNEKSFALGFNQGQRYFIEMIRNAIKTPGIDINRVLDIMEKVFIADMDNIIETHTVNDDEFS